MNNSMNALLLLIKESISASPTKTLSENDTFTNCDLAEVLRLAEYHGVVNTIYSEFVKLNTLKEETKQQLNKLFLTNINQLASQEYYSELLFDKLEEHKIDYMPLKGDAIRKLYPEKQMRISCDIDVFIHSKDDKKVRGIMDELGFSCEYTSLLCDTYKKTPFVNFEIHKQIEELISNDYYKDIWSRTKNVGFKYEMSDEDAYIHSFVHLAKHIKHGGSGIRSFVDLFMFLKQPFVSSDYVKVELEKLKLTSFARYSILLSQLWFSNNNEQILSTLNEEDKKLISLYEMLVFSGGTYGCIEQSVSTSLASRGKFKYFLYRIFLPYKLMCNRYHILVKAPILLPFCWIARIFNAIFVRRKKVKKELNIVKTATHEDNGKFKNLIDKLEI